VADSPSIVSLVFATPRRRHGARWRFCRKKLKPKIIGTQRMLLTLTERQQQIIRRAANFLKPGQRSDYEKFVEDVLRAKSHPLSNTDIRHASSAALLKFANRRSR
jgi:hypothetical protein